MGKRTTIFVFKSHWKAVFLQETRVPMASSDCSGNLWASRFCKFRQRGRSLRRLWIHLALLLRPVGLLRPGRFPEPVRESGPRHQRSAANSPEAAKSVHCISSQELNLRELRILYLVCVRDVMDNSTSVCQAVYLLEATVEEGILGKV